MIALCSFLESASFRLIQPRCKLPVTCPCSAGFSPSWLTAVCSSRTKVALCVAYFVNNAFRSGAFTFSAAVLKPCSPSLAVSTNSFSTDTTSLLMKCFYLLPLWTQQASKDFLPIIGTYNVPGKIASSCVDQKLIVCLDQFPDRPLPPAPSGAALQLLLLVLKGRDPNRSSVLRRADLPAILCEKFVLHLVAGRPHTEIGRASCRE